MTIIERNIFFIIETKCVKCERRLKKDLSIENIRTIFNN